MRADGSTTLRRNGTPVYGSFFQQSSFATHALTPARDAIKVRHDAPLEFLGPLGCGLQTGAGRSARPIPSIILGTTPL
jgi:aryl-alcohol dehydrogenase